ncbi:MAG: cupredoxin domain-containing protein [Solirubrobacterales bacterium]
MPRFPLATSLAILLALLMTACGGGREGPTDGLGDTTSGQSGSGSGVTRPPRAVKVRIVESFYDPDPVAIQEGGKVIWRNEDPLPHAASAEDGSFNTGIIEPGKVKSETFKEAGTFRYVCEIHSRMHGTIEVVAKE